MTGQYDKVIVCEDDGEKKVVVIFDEKLHIPVVFGLNRYGMDEYLEFINKVNKEPKK